MTIDVAKLTGFAAFGPPDDGETITKLTGYAAMGPPSNGIALTKLTGYVVMYPAAAVSRRAIVNCCT
jgi:hypothetical protein